MKAHRPRGSVREQRKDAAHAGPCHWERARVSGTPDGRSALDALVGVEVVEVEVVAPWLGVLRICDVLFCGDWPNGRREGWGCLPPNTNLNPVPAPPTGPPADADWPPTAIHRHRLPAPPRFAIASLAMLL